MKGNVNICLLLIALIGDSVAVLGQSISGAYGPVTTLGNEPGRIVPHITPIQTLPYQNPISFWPNSYGYPVYRAAPEHPRDCLCQQHTRNSQLPPLMNAFVRNSEGPMYMSPHTFFRESGPPDDKHVNLEYFNGAPDFSSFVTCFRHLKYTGLYLDGSLANYMKICIPILFLMTGTVSFAMADILHFRNKNTIWIIENGHWCIVYIAVIFWDTQMGMNSQVILNMSKAVKSGVYRYEKYELVDRQELEKTNARVLIISRVFGVVYFVAVMGTLVKSTILEEYEPHKHFFNGWFPFEINSLLKVNIVRIYELGCGWSAASGACTFFVTFMAYAYHIEAHLQLLLNKLERIFDFDESESNDYRQRVDLRIRECLGHHRAILRLFNDFTKFSNPTVGCSTLMATFMVCTLLYLMTNPDFDVSVIITFSGVVAPEFCLLVSFRIRGQKITDLSLDINKTLYELKWLEQDAKMRKDLLMWLRLTSKPLELKAFGYRNMSHAGIKEVLQTSYTFFNMLKASTSQM